jgi:hypothetical protein
MDLNHQPAGASEGAVRDAPAEGQFPVILVVCYGLLAVAAFILVLLTALGVAGRHIRGGPARYPQKARAGPLRIRARRARHG